MVSTQVDTIEDNRVLVPTAVWKAIYDPHALAAGAWLCSNTDRPACQVLSIDALASQVGIVDPFPGLPPRAKARLLPLPLPPDEGASTTKPAERHRRREHSLISRLSWEADATWTAPCSPTPAPQCGRAGR